jgi:hypothetical protein
VISGVIDHGAGCPAATNSLRVKMRCLCRRASGCRVVWFPNEFSDVVWIAVEFRLYYKPFARRPAGLLSHIVLWRKHDVGSIFGYPGTGMGSLLCTSQVLVGANTARLSTRRKSSISGSRN